MTVRTLVKIAMLALPAFTQGCSGGDCATLCEEMNACPDAATISWRLTPASMPGPLNCDGICGTDALNEKANCEDQFSDLWECVDRRDDVCQADHGCQARWDFYADCLAGFCVNNAADADCRSMGF